ncbi:hypothetical protein UlMin_034201 [Ulmus minor]
MSASTSLTMPEEEYQFLMRSRKWYFSKEEIEDNSPSRKDGIDLLTESHLRKLYCSFIQELGIKLKVPQVTIASAMMLCHRFYMRQSHAKNDWQTIATVCIFLACKLEETPRYLNDFVVVAYEMMNKWDPSAPRRIRQREFFNKQKELIIVGERLLLSTIAFDLDIQLPYKPLVAALKKLNIFRDHLARVAWNFVNDWLCTTLCLQYRPHYIAAGSMFLAAKLQKVKLPTEKGQVWWLEFDVSLKQLEEVIQHMRRLLAQDKKPVVLPSNVRIIQSKASVGKPFETGSQSCVSSETVTDCHSSHRNLAQAKGSEESSLASNHSQILAQVDSHITVKEVLPCHMKDSDSSTSIVEDGDGEILSRTADSDQKSRSKPVSANDNCSKFDINRIRESIKRRRFNVVVKKSVEAVGAEIDSEAWIESELENGIELQNSSTKKRRQVV